ASHFRYVIDGNEGLFVDFVDDFLHLAVFKPVDDAGDFFMFGIRVGAFDNIVCRISAEAVVNGLDDQFRFTRNNFIGFGTAESFFNQVDHFGSDVIGDSREESAFQAENERNDDKDENVQEQDHVTRPERQFTRKQDGQHVDSIKCAAVPQREAHADPDDDSADDGDQQRVAFDDDRNVVHHCRCVGKGADADDGIDGKTFPDLLIAEINKRQIQYSNQNAERHTEQLGADDAEPGNAAVRNIVRNQHGFEAICSDEGTGDDDQCPHQQFQFSRFWMYSW